MNVNGKHIFLMLKYNVNHEYLIDIENFLHFSIINSFYRIKFKTHKSDIISLSKFSSDIL